MNIPPIHCQPDLTCARGYAAVHLVVASILLALLGTHLAQAAAAAALFESGTIQALLLYSAAFAMLGWSWWTTRRPECLGWGRYALHSLWFHADAGWIARRNDALTGPIQILPDSVMIFDLLVIRIQWSDGRRSTRLFWQRNIHCPPSAKEGQNLKGYARKSWCQLKRQLLMTKGG